MVSCFAPIAVLRVYCSIVGDGTCANQTKLNEIQNGVGVGSELALWQNSFFGFEMFHKIKSFIHEAVEAVSVRSSCCILSHVLCGAIFGSICRDARLRISDPASI